MTQSAFDFDSDDLASAAAEVADVTYSVGELAGAINRSLRRDFGDGVWVRGEIQGWSVRGPHAYFSLADDTGDAPAIVNVQFFAPSRARLTPVLRKSGLELGDGLHVRIFGHLDLYAPNGRIGLKMSGIDPRFTLGELALARDAVIRRLVANGSFDANRSRRMPPAPLRVGVVTSVGSAAWHDFRHEIEASGLGFRLTVADTRVQGDTAVRAVTTSLRRLARHAAAGRLDAVVVIRGGGSRSDLATFDAESIALAIAECPVPVLTGLGHEVDRSVADEVAHTALKTPTACAAALVEAVQRYVTATESAWRGIERSARDAVAGHGALLDDRARRIAQRTHAAVARADDRLDARLHRVRYRAPQVLDHADGNLGRLLERLARRPGQVLHAEERHLTSIESRLALLDPAVLLARGWSITCTADGRAVRSTSDVAPGDVVRTRVADGSFTSRVEADPAPPADAAPEASR